jgi:predicted nuclease of predicted toxin-antitoxin system
VTVRLLLDEMYPPVLADILCQYSHDVVAVAARADLVGLDDAVILETATGDERCLVTENIRDFGPALVSIVSPSRWTRLSRRNGYPVPTTSPGSPDFWVTSPHGEWSSMAES